MRVAIPGGVTRCAAFLGLSLLVGCGPDFDPPSELHSLRILAVQKDVPYAQPDQDVNLELLWRDASGKQRPVQIAWSPACFDPLGDLYYECFTNPDVFGSGMFTIGDSVKTTFTMPTDIISRKPPPVDARNAPYGIAYVFFAVCAGTLSFVPPSSDPAIPIACKDADGNLLGSDDFVAGYTAVYSFKSFSNDNPVIQGFEFNGKRVASPNSCLGEDCIALAGSQLPESFDCADDPARCVPTCKDDGDSSCQAYSIRPIIDKADPANQNQDDVSVQLLGRNVGEQMWINYYTEAGGFKSPVRLLNDATSGWNDAYGTDFYAPKNPGVFRAWAIVHDNRGGVAWSGVTLRAQ